MEWPASNFHSKRVPSNALCAGLHGGCEGVSQKGAQSFPSTNPSHWHCLLWRPLRFLIPATKTSPWPSSKWSSAVTNYIISNSTSSMLIKSKMKILKREGGRDLILVHRGTLPRATSHSCKAPFPSEDPTHEAEWRYFFLSAASLFYWFLLMELLWLRASG